MIGHFHWIRHFQVIRPLPEQPIVGGVGCETRVDTSYAWYGRTRVSGESICLQITLDGWGVFEDATGRHRIEPEMGFLCRVKDPAIAYYYPPESLVPWRFVFLSITGAKALEWGEALIREHGGVYHIPKASTLMQRLLGCEHNPPTAHVTAMAATKWVIDTFAALEQIAQRKAPTPARALLERALEIVAERRHEPLLVSDVAAALRVSREHLSRVFQQELGISAHAYIVRQRTLYACQLLQQPERSVKQIARELGYPGSAQFSRAFRHLVGMPPSEYRRGHPMPTF